MTVRSKNSEHDEQVAVIQWAAVKAFNKRELAMLYAIPNGGHRHKAVGGKLKAEGVKSGVPDLCLPVPVGEFCGLYIEMKRANGVPSDVKDCQRAWIDDLNKWGYRAEVCFGANAAISVIEDYLG